MRKIRGRRAKSKILFSKRLRQTLYPSTKEIESHSDSTQTDTQTNNTTIKIDNTPSSSSSSTTSTGEISNKVELIYPPIEERPDITSDFISQFIDSLLELHEDELEPLIKFEYFDYIELFDLNYFETENSNNQVSSTSSDINSDKTRNLTLQLNQPIRDNQKQFRDLLASVILLRINIKELYLVIERMLKSDKQ
ncbi:hypothetical protein KQX54_002137 [Cotesia glomerata]|uniref:Uncharacterized protein n=1 Tax=Cotesia glomerata TaxID=32391 RepID=A0AAV7J038_COTGL|nr:hypothetical protein KQX54_002137 [Cotesia glomerata]